MSGIEIEVGLDGGDGGLGGKVTIPSSFIRDLFAGFAVVGLIQDIKGHEDYTISEVASDAYAIADALMIKRKGRK